MPAEVPHCDRFGISMHLISAFSYACNFLSEQIGIFVMPKQKLDSKISVPHLSCITEHKYQLLSFSFRAQLEHQGEMAMPVLFPFLWTRVIVQ